MQFDTQGPSVIDDNPELQPVGAPPPPHQHSAPLPLAPATPSGAVGPALPPADIRGTTPAQAKVDAIAQLTMSAYSRAATLQLTPEEIAKLTADFPDEAFQPGAAGKEHLIYIEHADLRNRLNSVFGPGQWAIVPRNRWGEDYTYEDRNGKTKEACRVYVEAMLLIRGCFVAEAIGDMTYFKGNDSQNYGDAAEGAKTAALRRCCKELGVGLQAWKKEWAEGWWARRRAGQRQQRQAPPATTTAPAAQPAQSAPKTTTKAPPPPATPESRLRLIESLKDFGGHALEYYRKLANPAVLLPTEGLDQLPLEFVPITQHQWEALKKAIIEFTEGAAPRHAFPPNLPAGQAPATSKPVEVPRDATPAPTGEEWRTHLMPFGTNKDIALGELDKKYLYGLWANFKVETEYKGKPRPPEKIAVDTKLREMLDQAGQHYQFTVKS